MLGTIVFSAGTSEGKIKAMDRRVDKIEQCIEHTTTEINKNSIDIAVIKASVLRIEEKVK
jgi:hypothetical protein